MEKLTAIIKEGIVNDILVGTVNFVSTITSSGDLVVDVTDIPCGIRWEYDINDNTFTNPTHLAISMSYLFSGISLEEYTERELRWRDLELLSTDTVVTITDHTHYNEWMQFRQDLRDYPQKEGFPNIALRPVPSHFTEAQLSIENPSSLLSVSPIEIIPEPSPIIYAAHNSEGELIYEGTESIDLASLDTSSMPPITSSYF
jgi:hypothetical protein